MKKEAAKIITVFSCKGGVGKTTLTLNLAGIYSLMDKKVLIIDLDLNSGGIALSLNVDCDKTIFNVVDDISNNRYENMSGYISKYNDKIDVLPAPKDPRNAFKIDSKYIDMIITSCIYKYDVILIDTNHNLNAILLSALDKSDNTVFMITNDPVDLKNSRSMIAILDDNKFDNYKVVFNSSKDTGKDYFSLYDVKNIIRHNIDYTIDNSFYIKDIDKGEYSLIYIDNKLVNVVLKYNDVFMNSNSVKYIEKEEIPKEVLSLATNTHKISNYKDYLFMRIDIIKNESNYEIMEVELLDPNLYLNYIPDKKQRKEVYQYFAQSIKKRITKK